jgi:hypothetical protein
MDRTDSLGTDAEAEPLGRIDEELDERIPCPDESCVGTVGDDGKCRYCAAQYAGDLPARGASPRVQQDDDSPSHDAVPATSEDVPHTSEGPPAALETDDEAYWSNRRLCRDGTCVGVVGDDGVCAECGLPA